MAYNYRIMKPQDASSFLNLLTQTDQETNFMTTKPGERNVNVFQLSMGISTGVQVVFLAELAEQLVGHLALYYLYGRGSRVKHVMHIGISVLREHWGKGIGNNLFELMETWAFENGIIRLELNVMTHNERGIALYKKRGFEIEGMKKSSVLINGEYIDEYLMSKILKS